MIVIYTGDIYDVVVERKSHRRTYDELFKNATRKLGRDFTTRMRLWLKKTLPAFYTHGFKLLKLNGINYESNNANALAQYPNLRVTMLLNSFINDPLLMPYLEPNFARQVIESSANNGIPLEMNDDDFQLVYGKTLSESLEQLCINDDDMKNEEKKHNIEDIYRQCITTLEDWMKNPDGHLNTGVDEFLKLSTQSLTARANILGRKKQKKEIQQVELDVQGDVIMKEVIIEEGDKIMTLEEWNKAQENLIKKFHFVEASNMNFFNYCSRIPAGKARFDVAWNGFLPADHRYTPSALDVEELQDQTPGFIQRREMNHAIHISSDVQKKIQLKYSFKHQQPKCSPDIQCIHAQESWRGFVQQQVNVQKKLADGLEVDLNEVKPEPWVVCSLHHLSKMMIASEHMDQGLKSMDQMVFNELQVGIDPCCGAVLQTCRDMAVGDVLGLLMGDLVTETELKHHNNKYLKEGRVLQPLAVTMDSLEDVRMNCTRNSVSSKRILIYLYIYFCQYTEHITMDVATL